MLLCPNGPQNFPTSSTRDHADVIREVWYPSQFLSVFYCVIQCREAARRQYPKERVV